MLRARIMPTPLPLLVTRAAHLVGLGVAPVALSPDPSPPAAPALSAVASLVGLAAVCGAAAWGRARLGTKAAATGAALAWLTVAAALGATLWSDRTGAPLGSALPVVATLAWGAIAAFAGAIVARAGRPVALGAAPAAVVGVALVAATAPWVRSADAIRWRAISMDPSNARALAALVGGRLTTGDLDGAAAVADRCLAGQPASCPCLALRAEVSLRRPGGDARVPTTALVAACPRDPRAHLVYAQHLARTGDVAGAERELALAAVLDPDPADLAYARAATLERAGRYAEALAAADAAVAAGAGRDAALLAAALRIGQNDLEGAAKGLEALAAANPKDAEVRYDLALVADKSADYNRAREGYLATLRLDAKHRSARYNLALLTMRAGALDEARHHAETFVRTFPGDPDGPRLVAIVASAPAPRR